jgi:hypothetical protein
MPVEETKLLDPPPSIEGVFFARPCLVATYLLISGIPIVTKSGGV